MTEQKGRTKRKAGTPNTSAQQVRRKTAARTDVKQGGAKVSRTRTSSPGDEAAAGRRPARKAAVNGTDRLLESKLRVLRSPRHGRGVFAEEPIRKGERIIEYKGKRVSWAWASRKYAEVEGKPTHTFLFHLDDGRVIDANQEGNKARWINHSCAPNCHAVEEDGHVYIEALRNIKPGEELGYEYNITIDERLTPAEKKRWPCYCGARQCRGTLLVPKHKTSVGRKRGTARR